jgi:2-dehydro-3-deoxyphosphogluconate aldolase / (4S)-4-hydroxy-2-oxoglutarate aldolase
MDKRTLIHQTIERQGILPLYYHPDPRVSCELAKALYLAGVRALEYTNRGTQALANFALLRSLCEQQLPGMLLGAGTVKDGASAFAFLEAGADFIVSPGLAEDVYDITYSSKALWIPGCMTVTEIMQAEAYGLKLIKLFPASLLGPGFIEALRDIFPGLQWLPTGGIGTERQTLKAWFGSGALAVGMGSNLLPKDLVEQRAYGQITASAKTLLREVETLRSAAS